MSCNEKKNNNNINISNARMSVSNHISDIGAYSCYVKAMLQAIYTWKLIQLQKKHTIQF